MIAYLQRLGTQSLDYLQVMGHFIIFLSTAIASIFQRPFRLRALISQIHFIGVRSIFIIVLTAVFTGMVLGLQGYYTLAGFGSEGFLGSVVALSVIRELGPVLAALMVTARAGSALTTELGIMRIREHLDALEVMGIDPFNLLIGPRILAGIIVLPLLTGIFDIIGILGGYLVGVQLLDLSSGVYFGNLEAKVSMHDINLGIMKSLSFGLILTWVATYKGYFASRGAEGVGAATTSSVVLSSVLILIWDYLITSIML